MKSGAETLFTVIFHNIKTSHTLNETELFLNRVDFPNHLSKKTESAGTLCNDLVLMRFFLMKLP